jgi:cytochrome b561
MEQVYDARSIRLHWITAVVVAVLWCLGETVDWFPRGTARVVERSTHIALGALLGLIVGYRIWWRASAGRRLPPASSGAIQLLATLGHYLLYALLVATVVLGLANVWVRGDNIFNLFTVPAFDPGNKPLRGQVEELHSLSANTLVIVAGLHAVVALVHHFFMKDGVLRRMLPALKR